MNKNRNRNLHSLGRLCLCARIFGDESCGSPGWGQRIDGTSRTKLSSQRRSSKTRKLCREGITDRCRHGQDGCRHRASKESFGK